MDKESLIKQLNIVKNEFNKSIDIVVKKLEESKNKEKENPLTLKQMKEMIEVSGKDAIGTHVLIVDKYSNKLVAILDYCTEYGICAIYSVGNTIFTESNYGTKWLTYRV